MTAKPTARTANELAARIAAELGEGWRAVPDRHEQQDRFELHARAGERIRVVADGSRLTAYGLHEPVGRCYPSQLCLTPRTITFTADKTAHQMAADIRRRLIPNVQEVHREMTARRAARSRRLEARRELLTSSANLLPGLDWQSERNHFGDPEYTDAWWHFDGGRLDIRIEEYCEEQKARLTITEVRPDALLKILEVFAAHQTRSADRHGETDSR
jgi:hypothetical protein